MFVISEPLEKRLVSHSCSINWMTKVNIIITPVYTFQVFSPRRGFHQPIHSKCMVQWLNASARMLSVVHSHLKLRPQLSSRVDSKADISSISP